MNNPLSLKNKVGLLACALALSGVGTTEAALYFVQVSTAPLISSPSGPFSVDFQMNYGGSGSGNSANVNTFTFGVGAAVPGTTVYLGNPTGDVAAGFSLTANGANPFNEIAQSFTPGNSLSFYVNLTTNPSGATPDSFHFGILDSSTFPIGTSQPGIGLDLVEIDINGLTAAWSWAGTGEYAGVSASFTAVPEASTYVTAVFALLPLGVGAIRRLRNGKRTA